MVTAVEDVIGDFGESWIRALCTAAGLVPARPDSDRVGLDLAVHDARQEFIRVQVKTTEHADIHSDGLHFSLDVPTYDRLRSGSTPGYLMVVSLRDHHPRWTGHCLMGSIVRGAGFWLALSGLPATTNTSSITVTLPLANMITPAALRQLFP